MHPLIIAGALGLLPLAAHSQETWFGGNNNNDWNTAANWNPATVPGSADTASFYFGTANINGYILIGQIDLVSGTIQNGGIGSANGIISTNGTVNSIYGSTSLSTLTGTTTLLGSNQYTGATNVNAGTLIAGTVDAFSPFSVMTVAGGATLDLGGNDQFVNALGGQGTVTNGGVNASILTNIGSSSTFAGVIEDGLAPLGLTLSAPGSTLTLSGANTYSGATSVEYGTLQAGASGALSTYSTTTIASGGTLDLNGTTQSIATLYLNGGVIQNGSLSGNGIISTGGTVTSIGGTTALITTAGTTTLTGTNSYSGATLINGSTVIGGNANAFAASSPTVVAPGGILDLGNMAQTINNVTLIGGTLRGAGTLTGNLNNLSGAVDLSLAPGVLNIHGSYNQGSTAVDDALLDGLSAGTGYSQMTVSQSAALAGQLDLTTGGGFTLQAGDSFVLLTYATVSGDYSGLALNGMGCASSGKDSWNCGNGLQLIEQFGAGSLTLDVASTSVPLPGGWTTLLGGCAGLLLLRRDSRRRVARAS